MRWSRGIGVLFGAAVMACSDSPHSPIFNAPPPVEAPGRFRIGPDTLDLIPGEVRPLAATWTGVGTTLIRIHWESDNPAVVAVNDKGELTANALGAANIKALLTTASGIARASIHVVVVPLGTASVRFHATSTGWTPTRVRIAAGTRVTWTSGPLSWSEAPQDWLYLLDANYGIVDSLDLRTGTATTVYGRPGRYQFCSGACWDPPDFGEIEVF